MAIFSKKPKVPVVHAPVERTVLVRATRESVIAHLDTYSSLFSPKHSAAHRVDVATSADWMAVRLPLDVHPWQLHNLAYWMLDCDGADQQVFAVSAAGPDHPGYRLVRDPDMPDALCGWDDEGGGWTVNVPSNDIVRADDVPVARAMTCPSGFHEWTAVDVRFEDPGHAMNPRNEATTKSRKRLANLGVDVPIW